MTQKYYRIRVVVEECYPISDSKLMFASEYTHYRVKASFTNKHKAMGRFTAIRRMITREYNG